MKLERAKNAKRNLIMGIINQGICILLPFIVRSVFIWRLGAEFLGLSGLFSSVLGILSITDLGFSSAASYCMYKPIAENDTQKVNALLAFYRKVYFVIGLTILILGSSLLPILPKLINGTVPKGINIYLLYCMYLLNSVLGYWVFAYKSSLLNAYQRTDLISRQSIYARILSSFSQIVVLLITSNYYLYVVCMIAYTVVNNLLISRCVDRYFPQYTVQGRITNEDTKQIGFKISGLMINKVCQLSRGALDNICISMYLGLVETSIYDNYHFIMASINSVTGMITGALSAGIGNNMVLESDERNYEELKKLDFLYMWLSGWCAICMFVLYQPFMRLWVGESLMMSDGSMLLMCIYFYALKIGDIRAMYYSGAGLWWEGKFRAISEAAANIALNLILVRYWGIAGIILGTLIPLIIINVGMDSRIVFKHYFVHASVWEYYGTHLRYFADTILVGAITYLLSLMIHDVGFFGFCLRAVLCVIVPNLLFIALRRKTKVYKASVGWLMNVSGIKRKG